MGPSLEYQAKVILKSRELRNNSATESYAIGNPHEDRVRLVVEPRLESAKYAGSSKTAWYVCSSPKYKGGIISMLNGGGPMVESLDPRHATNQLAGAIFRGVLDVSASTQEHRSIIKSTGA